MQVLKKHKIDAGERDENGYYDYYYEYDDYEFVVDEFSLIARSYTDELEEVSFRAVAVKGERKMLTEQELSLSVFKEAIDHLKLEGKNKFKVLTSEGYEEVSI
ncbi:hypothetical protein L4D15_15200 [Enterovibrio norvegicus]|uniref:hypothetical protein n=1 Tax=Enterovibrio norvegicus TaxID=188144 RepID=UPI003D0F36F5